MAQAPHQSPSGKTKNENKWTYYSSMPVTGLWAQGPVAENKRAWPEHFMDCDLVIDGGAC